MLKVTRTIWSEQPRVLVIDEHPVSGILLSRLLEQLGCDVFNVTSAKDAILVTKEWLFELILLASGEPEKVVLQIAKGIRENEKTTLQIPIVAFTAEDEADLRAQYENAGITAFLKKPVQTSSLKRLIESLKERRRKEEISFRIGE